MITPIIKRIKPNPYTPAMVLRAKVAATIGVKPRKIKKSSTNAKRILIRFCNISPLKAELSA